MEVNKNSREYIESQKPEYLPTACPICGGKLQAFGLGPGGKSDFSTCRTICWGCGKRQDLQEDAANKTYLPIEEVK